MSEYDMNQIVSYILSHRGWMEIVNSLDPPKAFEKAKGYVIATSRVTKIKLNEEEIRECAARIAFDERDWPR